MQKILLNLLFFLSFNLGLCQNTHNYIINYKFINLERDLSFIEKMIWEDGIKYTFFSNKNICFLTDYQINAPVNVNLNSAGPTKVYLNYESDRLYHDLKGETAYKLKELKFEKVEEKGKTKFMGFEVTKYKSIDGNIEIFVTQELPWYVQPCAFAHNRFNGAVLKLVNHKMERAIVLTDYEQVTEVPDKYEDVITKIKNHPATKVETIVSPLLATEEEKNSKNEKRID